MAFTNWIKTTTWWRRCDCRYRKREYLQVYRRYGSQHIRKDANHHTKELSNGHHCDWSLKAEATVEARNLHAVQSYRRHVSQIPAKQGWELMRVATQPTLTRVWPPYPYSHLNSFEIWPFMTISDLFRIAVRYNCISEASDLTITICFVTV